MNMKFRPQRKNVNRHTEHGLRLLEKSLQQDGWIDAQTAAADGEIISGSARLEVAAEKFTDVEPIIVHSDGTRPIIVVRDDIPNADDPRAKRLSVAANQIAKTDFNPDGDILKAWADEDKDIRAMFADSEWRDIVDEADSGVSADAEPQFDRAEELREKWGTARGQVWRLGKHRVMCGDCTDAGDVARLMDGMRATLLFTDPPYGVSIGAKNRFLNSFQRAGRNLDDLDGDDGIAKSGMELREMLKTAFCMAREMVCADNCSVFVCAPQGGDLVMMMMMMMDAGLPVRHVINWVKNQPTFSLGRLDYEYQHEPILFTWVKTHKRKKDGMFHTSVWEVDKPRANAEHPTMKPVELYINAILNHTDAGDILYNPFCGSGTAIIAAENTGRRCYAMEIEPKYVAVSIQRWVDATGGTPELIND